MSCSEWYQSVHQLADIARPCSDRPVLSTESHLRRTIQDLFISGSETVTTTLKWSFLFMVLHRDVQQKVFDEIDRVVGSGRLPTMKDKTRMPYTQATIMECQRVGNIALFRYTILHTSLCSLE